MRRAMTVLVTALLVLAHAPVSSATPGVDRDTIKIGLHAPVTGASPLASDSVEKGKDLYFRWLRHLRITIHGRYVNVIVRNDQYNPSTAADVCREMINQDDVFMLMGFTGPDQIHACATVANQKGVPYAAPGSATYGLKRLKTYFATSTAWPRQSRMLADFLVSDRGARGDKNGIVYFGTPTHNQAHAHFVRAMDNKRAEIHYDRQIARTAGATEARLIIEEMKVAGIENVFVLTTPTFFLQLLSQAGAQDFHPLWTGIGLTMTFDEVARSGCSGDPDVKARFLAPYPAFADRDRFDEDFDKAVELFYPLGSGDNVMWYLWAHQKALAKMLEQPGPRLGRVRFVSQVERAPTIRTGIGPALRFRPKDHFGAIAVHVLRMDCADEKWHTSRSFVKDF